MPDHLPPEDDELELEPVDPEILAHERQRGQRKTDHAQAAVDDDLIRQAEIVGDPVSLEDLKKFRFTTRHLMILTALLALVMTFCQLWGAGLGLFIAATSAVAAGWFFTMRREQRQRHAVEQLRRELAAQQERRTEPERSRPGKEGRTRGGNRSPVSSDQPEQATEQADLNFSFSLKEMLIAFTAAAVLLGLVRLFGPGPLAILLGMIALGGLVAQGVGLEAPGIVVFGWWILLVLYLLLGLWSSTTSNQGAVGSSQGAVTIQAVDGIAGCPHP